jgi:Spy/CpxP family protein refolding chaperone
MKPHRLLPLCVLSAAIAFTAARALAQDTTPPPPPPPPPDASPANGDQQAPPAGHHRMRGYVLSDLTAKLSLTPDQQAKIGAILKSDHEQMRSIREDDSLAPEDKHAQVKALMESTKGQIRALLTPDQQAIFDTLPTHGAPPPKPTESN